jgi:hypothetical protein
MIQATTAQQSVGVRDVEDAWEGDISMISAADDRTERLECNLGDLLSHTGDNDDNDDENDGNDDDGNDDRTERLECNLGDLLSHTGLHKCLELLCLLLMP